MYKQRDVDYVQEQLGKFGLVMVPKDEDGSWDYGWEIHKKGEGDVDEDGWDKEPLWDYHPENEYVGVLYTLVDVLNYGFREGRRSGVEDHGQ